MRLASGQVLLLAAFGLGGRSYMYEIVKLTGGPNK